MLTRVKVAASKYKLAESWSHVRKVMTFKVSLGLAESWQHYPLSSMQPSIPVSSLLSNPSSDSMDSIAHAERQVEITLNDLVQTGALQESNCMDIESLLNLAGKS